ncbi:ABC transporter permease subunit [Phyllobacterium chamaecytisi]|uniref:ABC transporter permease subunit n=1 Tax=Phyllobacterium chamaecytisi TaxID=2876082 RepID=UPI001CCE931D|nr:ABC transporter permease subunit [Phyllobacterium sp. KW56]MBZ9603596.1 ABC transporter permease subunit [Phyllobacterium sp. KW56]
MADLAIAAPASNHTSRRGSAFWLVVPGIVFLLAFFLLPTLQMMSISFVERATGDFGVSAYVKLFGSKVYSRVLGTTFMIAFQVTVLCLLLGYPLAYWLSQQPARRQRIALMFILLPFWTSPLVLNFSWLVLLGRNGVVALVMSNLGLPGGDDLLFSRTTVLFAMIHTMLPLTVVTMLPVMNTVDKRLTMAAMTLGASAPQAFWQIYLPLCMRGVATAGLLVFISALGFFITPALVGGRQETMISQLIITQIQQLQNWQLGSALAVVLIAAALLTIFLYDRIFGLSTMSGGQTAGSAEGKLRLFGIALTKRVGGFFSRVGEVYGRTIRGLPARKLLSAYCTLVIAILLFPIIAFIPMAFTEGSFLSFPPKGLGIRWFEAYAASPLWVSATLRSFAIGIVAAALTLVIASFAAFALAKSSSRLAGFAFLLFMAPMVVPPIVIAISLFYLFAQLQLIATDISIVIGHTVIAMPIVFVILLATFKGHDWRLDQVASTLGANRFQVVRRVTLPLVRSGVVVGFVTGFLQSFQELTVAIFLGGGLKTTLPKQMWDDITLQVNPTLAAAAVVVLLIVIIMFVIIECMQPRRT